MRVLIRSSLILALLITVTGCAGKRTNITGTITRDGKPLVWKSEGGHLLVIFVPENRKPGQDPYLAETDRQAGTYRIAEIPAGRYLVAVHQFDERHGDSLNNKYDPAHTTIVVEVNEDNDVIDVDIPKNLPD